MGGRARRHCLRLLFIAQGGARAHWQLEQAKPGASVSTPRPMLCRESLHPIPVKPKWPPELSPWEADMSVASLQARMNSTLLAATWEGHFFLIVL